MLFGHHQFDAIPQAGAGPDRHAKHRGLPCSRDTSTIERRTPPSRWRFWLALPVVAQQALDPTRVPAAGKTPVLRVPVWTRASLGNGVELVVSEKHDLPLVSFSITFWRRRSIRESRSARPRCVDGSHDERGYRDSRRRGAVECAAASGRLHLDQHQKRVRLHVFRLGRGKFPTNAGPPRRHAPAFHVSRGRPGADPAATAGRVDPVASPARLDRVARVPARVVRPGAPLRPVRDRRVAQGHYQEDVAAFHQVYFRPGHALISVVGDVQAATARATVEKALASWTAGGDKPSFSYPKRRRPTRRRSTSSTSPARHSRRLRSGFPDPLGIRRTSTRSRS